ncbi:hypothetical protein AB3X52_09870 [Nocardioides sp. DS6]|uniref:Integral membrane protein n=1 Tax=Nocardioides eburneus TaxID=3231482 RepID=A0ABV3SYB3_9ACTN
MGNELGNKLEPPRLGLRRKKATRERQPQETGSEATQPLATADETASPVKASTPAPAEPEPTQDIEPEPTQVIEPEPDPTPTREPRTPRLPAVALTGHPAGAVAGLVVGLFMVLAVWACEQVSQSTRGTTSLGRAGFPLLLAIFILAVVIGMLLLRRFRTPSPGSTSFLGAGLVAVLSLLFLTDHIDSVGGSAIVVVLAAVSYVLARWVSVRYLDA